MATYNGEKYLQEQLDSFFAQTSPADLIVACDDCSSDRTSDVLEEAQRKSAIRFNVHRNSSTLGFMNNFLKAASLCDTDLVAFSDQDDVWQQDKIEKCIPYFNDASVQLVVHGSHVTDEDGTVKGVLLPSRRFRYINRLGKDPWYVPLGHTMVFRRSLLSFVDLKDVPPEMVCHERWIYLMANAVGRIVLLPELLVCYRRHEKNVTAGITDRTLATKLTRTVAADSMTSQAHLFNVFSVLLGDLASAHTGRLSRDLRSSSQYYHRVTKELEQRGALYDATAFVKKAAILSALLRHGAYRSRDHGGLGIGSLARDIVSVW